MDMQKIIIANWKMNLSLYQAIEACRALLKNPFEEGEIVISPCFIYLAYLSSQFPDLAFAAQNLSSISPDHGAFTGEVSAKMLRDISINYAIIGHSERRSNFNETNHNVKEKAVNAIRNNITPIICIGEDEKVKSQGRVVEFLSKQILESIPRSDERIIVAYEPVWAIGSGAAIEKEDLEEIISEISIHISKVAKNYQLVYGGSVNYENADKLSEIKKLDGLLIGSASLNFNEFIKIVRAYA